VLSSSLFDLVIYLKVPIGTYLHLLEPVRGMTRR